MSYAEAFGSRLQQWMLSAQQQVGVAMNQQIDAAQMVQHSTPFYRPDPWKLIISEGEVVKKKPNGDRRVAKDRHYIKWSLGRLQYRRSTDALPAVEATAELRRLQAQIQEVFNQNCNIVRDLRKMEAKLAKRWWQR